MKLWIMSDVHLEFGKLRIDDPPEHDYLVLAGDIGPGMSGIAWAGQVSPGKAIYVPGNHEYYGRGRGFYGHREAMVNQDKHDVAVLDRSSIEFPGIRFIGATLWTDYDLFGTQVLSMDVAWRGMNDYYDGGINAHGFQWIGPSELLDEHRMSVEFIRSECEKPFDGRTVVVTHRAPTELSVSETYRFDKLSPCFASRLYHLVESSGADLWIHGHMHHSTCYMVGDTRVTTNPRGYVGLSGHPGEPNPDWDKNMVVEV
jgi:predicted phosphodiesterase